MPSAHKFAKSVRAPGQPTDESLAEMLDAKPEDAEQLREDFKQIREAELEAERVASTIRLY